MEYLRGVFTHQPFKKGEKDHEKGVVLSDGNRPGCGFAMAKTAETPITPADLTDLKGAWTGQRSGIAGTFRTDLNIKNDSLPLKGDITLHWPKHIPTTAHFTGQIEDGRLKLSWNRGNGWADLRLRKKDDGSMELRGTIFGRGFSASATFKKVK